MKPLWTLLKVVIAIAIAIPVFVIVLATTLGILGALFGLAVLALKVAFVALIGVGAFRLIARLLGGPRTSARRYEIPAAAPIDPHYEAAMRELDQELGEVRR